MLVENFNALVENIQQKIHMVEINAINDKIKRALFSKKKKYFSYHISPCLCTVLNIKLFHFKQKRRLNPSQKHIDREFPRYNLFTIKLNVKYLTILYFT